jgi:hypothetical protein
LSIYEGFDEDATVNSEIDGVSGNVSKGTVTDIQYPNILITTSKLASYKWVSLSKFISTDVKEGIQVNINKDGDILKLGVIKQSSISALAEIVDGNIEVNYSKDKKLTGDKVYLIGDL